MTCNGQLSTLLTICPEARELNEAGYRFVSLPKLKVDVGSVTKVLDGLLAVTSHSNYSTRLFLNEQLIERPMIGSMPANWTMHHILGRSWWTWSWQGVPEHLPWIQILNCHLKALK
jgi:hypothetical protein